MHTDSLIKEYLPHAPGLGLYVAPQIPRDKLDAARQDYAASIERDDVLALYDATRLNTARDGALFLADRFIFQNNNLERAKSILYTDVVGTRVKRKFLGGRRLELDINRGRATYTESLDFSARSDAAEYVHRFLSEVLLQFTGDTDKVDSAAGTNLSVVRDTLDSLEKEGHLTSSDKYRMLDTFGSNEKGDSHQ